ncbi:MULTISPECIES: hypothetical protein [Hyphomicrobiales]|uniref:hypothetical protein n=1 Tax=Hyphomicrobiales TaxID=356 RepID=UPI0003A6917B|nr:MULTISPECIES: hypothetical protein [Phyllobacteriaceae]MCX8570147.1 hypothetical protein [Aminobacter sp. MET-1]
MSLNRHRNVMNGFAAMGRFLQVLLIGSASLAAPAAAYAGEMSSGEIRNELVGRSISWWEQGGWFSGQLMLLPDGRAEISVDAPKRAGDTGRWSVRGDQLCTEWGDFRSGEEKCYSLQRGAAGRFETSGGNVFEIRETGV